jgi:small basic protein (TIGR04137 family)
MKGNHALFFHVIHQLHVLMSKSGSEGALEKRLVLHGKSACLNVPFNLKSTFMSQHRSLRSSGTIAAKRNVLKRFERVDLLKKRGQWKEGRSVMNLPKTKPDA